jgi:hypothetical protein
MTVINFISAILFKKKPVVVEHDASLRAGQDGPSKGYKKTGYASLL